MGEESLSVKVPEWKDLFDFVKEEVNGEPALYPFQNDFWGLKERLVKRHEVVNEEGDLTIFSSTNPDEQLGKVDSFMWNLYRSVDTTEVNEAASTRIVISSNTTSTASSGALNEMIKFMYTGEMGDNLSHLLEITEKAHQDNRHRLISDFAERKLYSNFNMSSVIEKWIEVSSGKQVASPMLVNLSLAFILTSPLEAFACVNGAVWNAPFELLEALAPNRLKNYLEEIKGFEKSQFHIRFGENGACFINMDHVRLAEFLFCWALGKHQEHYDAQIDYDQRGITYQELENEIGDLYHLLEPKAFNLDQWKGTSVDPVHGAKGAYYYIIIVVNRSLSDVEKQSTNVYPFKSQDAQDMNRKRSSDFQEQRNGAVPAKKPCLLVHPPSNALVVQGLQDELNQTITHPIHQLLEEEFARKSLSNINFVVENGSATVSANSFLLSLWSKSFFLAFNGKKITQKAYDFGSVSETAIKNFIKLFYINKADMNNDVECMKLAVAFQIPSFVKLGIKMVQDLPLTSDTCLLRFMTEKIFRDTANADAMKEYIERNLQDVILSGEIEKLLDLSSLLEIVNLMRDEPLEFPLLQCVYRCCRLRSHSKEKAVEIFKTKFWPNFKKEQINRSQIKLMSREGLLDLDEAMEISYSRGFYEGQHKKQAELS